MCSIYMLCWDMALPAAPSRILGVTALRGSFRAEVGQNWGKSCWSPGPGFAPHPEPLGGSVGAWTAAEASSVPGSGQWNQQYVWQERWAGRCQSGLHPAATGSFSCVPGLKEKCQHS